mmetsp:Transcript_2654/g.3000  ORF Transcript_2654/g.3000 Transcript_2654/m.3000 type:complete len:264 (+) Transcript_2654:189-980(+)|eukprot:CAMPEP_0197852218 /NCGR_PEP_ID=MMETSP1438-20131217/19949_1 /TAXON_ID=1461541 /ORGANISM="Pterosperma sp., Strain CCMP1384" /LENGTH=263 /DNA_ID=CAMNT_0043466143 /DNA_START=171 /DNA_END=962 /DNA_ORIENTATION=-
MSSSSLSGPIPGMPPHMMANMANATVKGGSDDSWHLKKSSKANQSDSKASVWLVASIVSFAIFFLVYVRESNQQAALAACNGKMSQIVNMTSEEGGAGGGMGEVPLPVVVQAGSADAEEHYQQELSALRAELASVQKALDNTQQEMLRHEELNRQLHDEKSRYAEEKEQLAATANRLERKMLDKAKKRDEYLMKLKEHGIVDPKTKIRSKDKKNGDSISTGGDHKKDKKEGKEKKDKGGKEKKDKKEKVTASAFLASEFAEEP